MTIKVKAFDLQNPEDLRGLEESAQMIVAEWNDAAAHAMASRVLDLIAEVRRQREYIADILRRESGVIGREQMAIARAEAAYDRGRLEERAKIVAWMSGIDGDHNTLPWCDGWDWYPATVAKQIQAGEAQPAAANTGKSSR